MLSSYIATNDSRLCSGALIHPRIVLTAGHCMVKTGNRVEKLNSQGKMNTKNVSQVIINETFLKTKTTTGKTALNTASDLSLLLLDSAYGNVREILPKLEPRLEAAKIMVSGFGRNETNSIDGKLRAAVVNVIDIHKTSNLDPYGEIYVKKQATRSFVVETLAVLVYSEMEP